MLRKSFIGATLLSAALSGQLFAESTATPTPDIIAKVQSQLTSMESEAGAVPLLLVAPIDTVLVSPMFGRLEKHEVSLGSTFKRGQLLLAFVCNDRDAQVLMGDAEHSAAQINYENKLKLQGLAQAGEIEVTLAATDAGRTKAQLDFYKAQADQCDIRAPFDGRVSKVHVSPFQGVGQGEPLLEIVSTKGLKAVMNLPASWLSQIAIGDEVLIAIDETSGSYSAKLSAINSKVDSVSHTIEVEAEIENAPKELLPGMSGTGRLSR